MNQSVVGTRRQFVGTAGATLLIAGVSGLGFVANPDYAQADEPQFQWDEEADLLIVGGGLAGQAAAVCAALEGGSDISVVLLEKSPSDFGGGNSRFSSSCVIYGQPGNEAEVFAYLKELRHSDKTGTPDDVLEAYANELCQNHEWVNQLGVSDEDMTVLTGTENLACFPEWPELEHANYCGVMMSFIGKYTHIVDLMLDKIAGLPQIQHKLECPLTALVQDPESKRVLGGVYTNAEGAEIHIKANKGVIMTCGGFENNPQMMANYFSQPDAKPVAAVHNTGDGHLICSRLGAAMWHMNAGAGMWNAIRTLDDSSWGIYSGSGNPLKEYGITVGSNGRRFYMDWDACCTYDWSQHENGVSLESTVSSRHGHMQFGGDWHLLPMPAESWFICDQAAMDAGCYAAQGEDPVSEGFGYSADTIEELAEQVGLPADELVQTIETWNTYCENGRDLSFYRPESTLNPITTAPFYAMRCVPAMLNTDGGPVRDALARVIDLEGNPVPGLYSAGEFGSVWSGHYQGGGNLAECLAFGRIAARSALAEK